MSVEATRILPVPPALVRARIKMQRRDPWYYDWVAACRFYAVPDQEGKLVLATDENLRVFISPAALSLPTDLLAWLLRHEADHWMHRHFDVMPGLVSKLRAAGVEAPEQAANCCMDAPINAGISVSWCQEQKIGAWYGRDYMRGRDDLWDALAKLPVCGEYVTPSRMARWFNEPKLATDLSADGLADVLCARARQQQAQQQAQQQGQQGQPSNQGTPSSSQGPGQGQGQGQQPGQAQPTTSPSGAPGSPSGIPSTSQSTGAPGSAPPSSAGTPAAPSPAAPSNGAALPGGAANGAGNTPTQAPPSRAGSPLPGRGPSGMTCGRGADLPYVCDDPAPLSKADIGQLVEKCLDRVAEIEQERAGDAPPGTCSVPMAMRQLVDARDAARKAPRKVDWAQVFEGCLAQSLTRVEDGLTRYRYGEPEPIRVDPFLLPGRVTCAPSVLIVLDVSGSMGPYLQRVCDQVAEATERTGGRCLIAFGDDSLIGFMEWEAGDKVPASAQGGTRMERVIPDAIKRARSEGHDPAAVVLITDGETRYPTRETMAGLDLHNILVKDSIYYRQNPAPGWVQTYQAWEEVKR